MTRFLLKALVPGTPRCYNEVAYLDVPKRVCTTFEPAALNLTRGQGTPHE